MWLQVAIIAAVAIGTLVLIVCRHRTADLGSVSAQWRAEHVSDPS
jgi:hypothetical protein